MVDDGLATGATALAAARYLRRLDAGRVVLAVPVSPEETLRRLAGEVDDVVCFLSPLHLFAVGQAYETFGDTADEEVVRVLELARAFERVERREVAIPMSEGLELPGEVAAPGSPIGVVVFAHGSGSGRRSPRNLTVAEALHRRGLATVLFDLLTLEEAGDRAKVFDTELLGTRLSRPFDGRLSRTSCEACRSACSGRAPGRPPPFGRRPPSSIPSSGSRPGWRRWSPAGAGPTWR